MYSSFDSTRMGEIWKGSGSDRLDDLTLRGLSTAASLSVLYRELVEMNSQLSELEEGDHIWKMVKAVCDTVQDDIDLLISRLDRENLFCKTFAAEIEGL